VRPTSWLPLVVLALLVGLTLWLNQLVQAPQGRADGSRRHDPDVVVQNFSAKKLGVDGRVLYTLAAKKMVHYPDDDSAWLETLTMEAFEPGQPKITVTSDRGRLEQGGDRVWIEGNVVIVRDADPKQGLGPMRVTTEHLLVLPDAGIARTTDVVHMQSPTSRAVSQGLELDNKARTLKLQHVQATMKPTPRT
jgi:lipopolysaccharide export system protein LptC